MPPRIRRTRRRAIRRRRPTRGAVYSAAGKQLYRDVLKLKNFVNTEFKFHDEDRTFINVPFVTSSTGVPLIMNLNEIPLGTTDQTRTGATVRIKSMQHSCTIDNTTTGSLPCRVRMIFYLNLRNLTPAIPTIAQVLDISLIDPINAFRQLDNRSEIAILKDKVFRLDTDSPNDQREMKFYRKFNFHTQWTSADTAGTLIKKNALYCMVFCDQPGAVLPRIRCTTRLRYIDN